MASRMAAQANLDRFQCMFTWYREITTPVDSSWVVVFLEDKLRTSDCEWQSVVYHLVLSYECHRLNKDFDARNHLTSCEDIILNSECFVPSPLIKNNLHSIRHVLHSTWLHLVHRSETFETFKDYLNEVLLYKNMTRKQKAGVIAIHAACLMEYGCAGNILAVSLLNQAIKLDEHEGHWHYLKGVALRFERLSSTKAPDGPPGEKDIVPPGEKEISCFQLSHFYDEHTPSHYIGLAACLYESVMKVKGPSEVRDRATQLYKTALENWPNSPYVNLMCASGLLFYSYPVRNTKLVDKCLGKALILAPQSSHVNLVAAVFFKWPCNNQREADRHFILAKKRFSSLVQAINKGEITLYRFALLRGQIDSPPPPVAILDSDYSSDEDTEYPLFD